MVDVGIHCMRTSIEEVKHMGYLSKLGGNKDGRQGNWKRRFAVLKDDLYYYESEERYHDDPSDWKGKLKLNCHFVTITEGDNKDFEFTINALPKSLTIRADNHQEMEQWVQKLKYHGRVDL